MRSSDSIATASRSRPAFWCAPPLTSGALPLTEDSKHPTCAISLTPVRCVLNYFCALLYLAGFMTHAGMAEDPADRVRALIVADEESAKLAPDRWPDVSLKALREREALDRTTLDKLHATDSDGQPDRVTAGATSLSWRGSEP